MQIAIDDEKNRLLWVQDVRVNWIAIKYVVLVIDNWNRPEAKDRSVALVHVRQVRYAYTFNVTPRRDESSLFWFICQFVKNVY